MGCFWWCQLGKEINLMLASVCYQVSLQSSWQHLRPQFALCMTSPNGKNTPLSVLHCHMMRFRQFVSLMFFSYSWGEALNVSADSYHSLRKKIEPFVLFFPTHGEHGRATHTPPQAPWEERPTNDSPLWNDKIYRWETCEDTWIHECILSYRGISAEYLTFETRVV